MRTERAMRHNLSLVAVVTLASVNDRRCYPLRQTAKKPNILIIWGDDIGYWNLSAYNQGMMGYKTPNIDRIAKEGALFTDWYGQQSCTAGRSCFITGQVRFRTGLLKVGLPGAKEGLQARDVTIAGVAEGPRLHHRAVRQEPSRRPRRTSAHSARLRRVLRLSLPPQRRAGARAPGLFQRPGDAEEIRHARRASYLGEPGRFAEDRVDRPAQHRADETVDDEFTKEALRFMTDAKKADKPFFLWWNATRMHIWTHLKPAMGRQDRSGHLSRRHGGAR